MSHSTYDGSDTDLRHSQPNFDGPTIVIPHKEETKVILSDSVVACRDQMYAIIDVLKNLYYMTQDTNVHGTKVTLAYYMHADFQIGIIIKVNSKNMFIEIYRHYVLAQRNMLNISNEDLYVVPDHIIYLFEDSREVNVLSYPFETSGEYDELEVEYWKSSEVLFTQLIELEQNPPE